MDALRSESLPWISEEKLFEGLQDYYTALVFSFEEAWRKQNLTIIDFNTTLERITKASKKEAFVREHLGEFD